jgi:hypothetical protein
MGLWLGRRTGRAAAGELRRHLIEIGKETTGKTAHLLGFVHLDVVQRIEVAAEISYQPQLFRPLRECGIEGVLSRHNAKRRGEVLLIERLDGMALPDERTTASKVRRNMTAAARGAWARHLRRSRVASDLVGVAGFEPAASSSRTKRAAKLRHTPLTAGKSS